MFKRHRNPDSGPNYAKETVAEALTIAMEYAFNEEFVLSCCHLVVKWKFQTQSNCSKMGVQTFCGVRPGLAMQPRLALLLLSLHQSAGNTGVGHHTSLTENSHYICSRKMQEIFLYLSLKAHFQS